MQTTKHDAIAVTLTDTGRSLAVCSCGFNGRITPDRLVAEAQAQQHVAYVSEVATLTAAPPPPTPDADPGGEGQ